MWLIFKQVETVDGQVPEHQQDHRRSDHAEKAISHRLLLKGLAEGEIQCRDRGDGYVGISYHEAIKMSFPKAKIEVDSSMTSGHSTTC